MSGNTANIVVEEKEKARRLRKLYERVGTYIKTRGLPMSDVQLGLIIATHQHMRRYTSRINQEGMASQLRVLLEIHDYDVDAVLKVVEQYSG